MSDDRMTVPHIWNDEIEPGERWSMEIEHDCMAPDAQFTVTIYAEHRELAQDGSNNINKTLVVAAPAHAREMAAALLHYADEAAKENERRAAWKRDALESPTPAEMDRDKFEQTLP
jgi:hypothetical protein